MINYRQFTNEELTEAGMVVYEMVKILCDVGMFALESGDLERSREILKAIQYTKYAYNYIREDNGMEAL